MGADGVDPGATLPATVCAGPLRRLSKAQSENPGLTIVESEDLDVDETWARVKAAHESHDVVVTLGTGRISAEEERLMGLIGEHDYAVEDLELSDGGARRLLIKNPWCDAPLVMGRQRPELRGSTVHK